MSVLFLLLGAMLGGAHDSGSHLKVQVDKPKAAECEEMQTDLKLRGKPVLPRLQAACRKIVADDGQQFGEKVVQNLGRAMFVFLPLMAALMKLLYWHPPRYYLEHLVLLLHNHACVFLLLSMLQLALHWFSGGWAALLVFVTGWYLVRYLYRSMKVMYGQARWLTLSKFSVLAFAYLVCGSLMLLMTVFISAATLAP